MCNQPKKEGKATVFARQSMRFGLQIYHPNCRLQDRQSVEGYDLAVAADVHGCMSRERPLLKHSNSLVMVIPKDIAEMFNLSDGNVVDIDA